VGELGYELYVETNDAKQIYELLIEKGKDFNLSNCGMHAMDIMRMESGFLHWGHDISPEENQFQAGLSFTISNKDGIYTKKLDSKFIEQKIKKNFSLCWRWFYRMQIPMIIGYHEMFEDIATFHLWGTVVMNQAFNYKKNMNETNIHSLTPDYMTFNKGIVLDQENDRTTGVSAMSLSDMTNNPRATVIRKCKYLMSHGYLKLNDKKQYVMTGMNIDKIIPYQRKIFRNKAKFLRKTLNLLTIS
jgi:hypothetical protein